MTTNRLPSFNLLNALLLLAWSGQTPGVQPLPEKLNASVTINYDQVIAHMPRDRAATASVALAELNIALHNAKKRTEQTLCGGHWSPSGETLQQVGPLVARKRAHEKIWLYQSLRRAHPLSCDGISRAKFFLEMSRHLPEWVSIRPAGQTTGFNQGSALQLPPSHLAVR